MIEYACHALGWDVDEFDLYRVRIAHPILNSVVRMQFRLPAV